MSFHWERKKIRNKKANSIGDIMSDFTCLKVSALEKASRISAKIDSITIGPQSVVNKHDTDKLDNIENEQNSCNIKSPQKTYNISPKHATLLIPNSIFSREKIQSESELQRKENVWKEMKRHIQNMTDNGRAIQEHLVHSRLSMARERERRSAEKLAHFLAEEERLGEQEEIKRRHEQQLHAQRAQEQKERLKKEIEEYKNQEKEELMRAIINQRNLFIAKNGDIIALSEACKDKQAFSVLVSANRPRLVELGQQIGAIDEKIKSGGLVTLDLNNIETLVHHIDDMLNLFRTEIERINTEYEAELSRKTQTVNQVQPIVEIENIPAEKLMSFQQTVDAAVKEEKGQNHNEILTQEAAATLNLTNWLYHERNEVVVSPVPDSNPEVALKNSTERKEGNLYDYVDKESLQIYVRSQQFLAVYKQSYKDFLQSPDTKKFRFECQKAINIPVNAISGTNKQHLRDKYDRLQNLLTGRSFPNVMQHPQGIIFCKDHLAKKIVSQGETLVSSKPEMAFPVAAIVVALWNDHNDFGQLFLAHLHEACPFTVPVFLSQQEGQSNEDYYKSLGCKYSEDGTVEKQDKFLKRMSGLMRLYASITVTEQRNGVTKIHPHGLQYAWRWLATVLNFEPRAEMCDLCATLILDMLQVAGNILWMAYPKQFRKLLILLMEQYYPRIQNVAGAGGGPLVRLEEFLNNALTKGTIRPADGLLPSNFW